MLLSFRRTFLRYVGFPYTTTAPTSPPKGLSTSYRRTQCAFKRFWTETGLPVLFLYHLSAIVRQYLWFMCKLRTCQSLVNPCTVRTTGLYRAWQDFYIIGRLYHARVLGQYLESNSYGMTPRSSASHDAPSQPLCALPNICLLYTSPSPRD